MALGFVKKIFSFGKKAVEEIPAEEAEAQAPEIAVTEAAPEMLDAAAGESDIPAPPPEQPTPPQPSEEPAPSFPQETPPSEEPGPGECARGTAARPGLARARPRAGYFPAFASPPEAPPVHEPVYEPPNEVPSQPDEVPSYTPTEIPPGNFPAEFTSAEVKSPERREPAKEEMIEPEPLEIQEPKPEPEVRARSQSQSQQPEPETATREEPVVEAVAETPVEDNQPAAETPASAPEPAEPKGKVLIGEHTPAAAAPQETGRARAPQLAVTSDDRPVTLVAAIVRQHRQCLHQAKARRRHAGGTGGHPSAGRPRRRDGDAHHRHAGIGPVRASEVSGEEVRGVMAEEVAKGARPRRHAARTGSLLQAACDPRCRRQRHRKDDHDRQARRQIARRRAEGDARRGRHVPRRGDRAVENLGRPHGLDLSSARNSGRTPPGFAWDAFKTAQDNGSDVVIIDTAGPFSEQG
jgi:hypothetical protein